MRAMGESLIITAALVSKSWDPFFVSFPVFVVRTARAEGKEWGWGRGYV